MNHFLRQIFSRRGPRERVSDTRDVCLEDTFEDPLPSGDFKIRTAESFQSKDEVYEWIEEGIKYFKEWYQPVDFGNGIIAHQTRPPDWGPRPDLFNDNGGGLSKWNYIVKKHLPDVTGKRVLDLGCSNGLFSLELARMGAKEVIGIDRNLHSIGMHWASLHGLHCI